MERHFELRAPVTPYVCSTPDDFTEEREWIAERVFPTLAELCIERGTYFSPVDVRWKPDDDLAQNGCLLSSLLNLVSESSPYFMCLLGERYGPCMEQMPARSTLQSPKATPRYAESLGLFCAYVFFFFKSVYC
jgi:hypothetical protein